MADAVHDAERLKELQSLPLERKIQISQARIIEWYNHWGGNVVVSFSGGKDSTVLLHLVRSIYPDVKAVFSNTGLEYPEIQKHVKSFDNVDIVVPKMRFDEVISTYGYPLIGKEVAEAIYYARRIRSQSGNVERERERDGTARRKTRTSSSNSESETSWKDSESELLQIPSGEQAETRTARIPTRGRPSKSGKWEDYHRRTLHPNESDPRDKDCFWNKPSETDWHDWRRGCL